MPCQLAYHPQKREGFGFTDGEGCERTWASLQKLIPGLRVSGVCHTLRFAVIHTTDAPIKPPVSSATLCIRPTAGSFEPHQPTSAGQMVEEEEGISSNEAKPGLS